MAAALRKNCGTCEGQGKVVSGFIGGDLSKLAFRTCPTCNGDKTVAVCCTYCDQPAVTHDEINKPACASCNEEYFDREYEANRRRPRAEVAEEVEA